jgi:hypothetical protein
LVLPVGQERNFAFQVAEPGNSRWQNFLGECRDYKKQQNQKERSWQAKSFVDSKTEVARPHRTHRISAPRGHFFRC